MHFTTLFATLSLALAAPTSPGYVSIPLTHPLATTTNGTADKAAFYAPAGYAYKEKHVREYSAQLVKSGIVKNSTYALSLGESSEIVFGGVNTGRYEGELKTINGEFDTSHYVFKAGGNLNGLAIDNSTLWYVDAGEPITYLNQATFKTVMDAVFHNVGVRMEAKNGFNAANCSDLARGVLTLETAFFPVTVTLADLSIPADELLHNGDKDTCFFGIGASSEVGLMDTNVLGANFLKNFYSVFDIQTKEVKIAKPAFKDNHYQVNV